MTEHDIYTRLSAILVETFDIEPERIRPEARLYDDLDIDSIDAVDLIVKLKPLVGKRLQPEAFKSVRTLQDVVNALTALLQQAEETTGEDEAALPRAA
ncbi:MULTISPECIES: acyl carrier protein [unclassified Roseateles]|uniref:acyl carrier protein n=1 Tax=Pelomonas sp. Root1237 TaxID=1736434 RepID=UPI0006F84649|nr:acyl carrier protein [Pelomonas sp. Root1237]KQV85772.1 acyl carrier protein [Pelomonas sp. Root1237]